MAIASRERAMGAEKVAVGIRNDSISLGALKWALDNLIHEGEQLTLIHVLRPIRFIPTPVGNLAVGQLSEAKVASFVRQVHAEVDEFVETFKNLCTAHKVKVEFVKVEGDSVQKALVSQIPILGIGKLVLGSSGPRGGITRRVAGPGIPAYVSKQAPAFCTVLIISKNKVLFPKKNDECGSFSSSHSHTSESEAVETVNSSCSSQGDADTQAAGTLHGLPDGLGHRWSFVSNCLGLDFSEKLRLEYVALHPIPLDEVPGARIFTSPFGEPDIEVSSSVSEEFEQNTAHCNNSGGSSVVDDHNLSNRKSVSEPKCIETPDEYGLYSLDFTKISLSKQVQEVANEKNKQDEELESKKIRERSDEELPKQVAEINKNLSQVLQRRYREYDYEELKAATDNFADELKLGEGGYGLVYRGRLDNRLVAIKVLKKEGFSRTQEFQREVELLGRIQHPHMVVLLGSCPEKGCLVYEYMENGSLDDRLFCKEGTEALPWHTRFRVAAEIASALNFLHSLGTEPIVHRDLKPANILLNENYVSKLGDVGLARLVPERLAAINSTYFRDTTPVGTFAYIDPEYQRTGSFGPKSDVYALGIVMLQLLTRKPAVGVHAIVEEALDCGTFSSILDKSAGDWPVAKAEEVACLALQCAEMRRRHRPNLDTVIPILDSARAFAENYAAVDACRKVSPSSESSFITPSIFLCPIFQEVMVAPVVAADGYTYDYEAIRQWLQEHDTSPLTNLKLEHKQLTPHHALHKLISEWQSRVASDRGAPSV